MKLIKKIVAIMFTFMMVVSMSCNVKANDTTATTETGEGKITINNAIPGQTYKIYKILELESYDSTTGNYAYKVTPEWKSFVENEGQTYLTKVDGTDYVNWVGDSTNDRAHVKEFAEKAIAYVKKANSPVITYKEKKAPDASAGKATLTVTFDSLPLGYYLVDSSVGSLCGLDTTAKEVTIEEKNGVPSVDKKVSSTETRNYDTSNTASIGDTVYFKTTITAQPGAQNYVLHDKMDAGLTFNESSVKAILNKNEPKENKELTATDYSVVTSDLEDSGPKCTFHIEFTPKLCESLKADDTITVTYSATLNDKAVIGSTGNVNETKLNYGDSKETTESKTHTFTYDIPVFKYTMKDNVKTELEHAKFTLSLNEDGANPIKFKESNEKNKYIKDETGAITEVESPQDGKLTFEGLGAGTYYLTETKQPDGYNKLAKSVKIDIDDNGAITVDGKMIIGADKLVEVENKTGTVLPSTGGAGTTMIYLVGAVLVLGSGVVLATKRRVKNK